MYHSKSRIMRHFGCDAYAASQTSQTWVRFQILAASTAFLAVLTWGTIDNAHAQGVAVTDAAEGVYLPLRTAEVLVSAEGQVAVVTATHEFLNTGPGAASVTYAFPMREGASATRLRYRVNGEWFTAKFSATPQDSSITEPGESMDPDLTEFIGETPLFYAVAHDVPADSSLVVELTIR